MLLNRSNLPAAVGPHLGFVIPCAKDVESFGLPPFPHPTQENFP